MILFQALSKVFNRESMKYIREWMHGAEAKGNDCINEQHLSIEIVYRSEDCYASA